MAAKDPLGLLVLDEVDPGTKELDGTVLVETGVAACIQEPQMIRARSIRDQVGRPRVARDGVGHEWWGADPWDGLSTDFTDFHRWGSR